MGQPNKHGSAAKQPLAAHTAVVVPVKSFDMAKGRLADRLSPGQRSALAKAMATRVVAAAQPLPTFVICDTEDVAGWAASMQAQPLWSPVTGLNPSVTYGRDTLRNDYEQIIVAHADLPLATDLSWLGHLEGVTIVQDRRGEGTNVLSVPTAADFRFCYGEGSSALHLAEAKRLGIPVTVIDDDELGWDVDTASDFDQLPQATIKVLTANSQQDTLDTPSSELSKPESE